MKKALKILGWFLLAIICLVLIVIVALNARYNSATKRNAETQTVYAEANNKFFTFELEATAAEQPAILPVPKQWGWLEEYFSWPAEWRVTGNLEVLPEWITQQLGQAFKPVTSQPNLSLSRKEGLAAEAYNLTIGRRGVAIEYTTEAGLNYALVTLVHLQQLYPEGINGIRIEDEPDMEVRGVMLDISRDKVPTLETLYGIVDRLAMLKYNHLQLYVEGFSFGYPSYRHLWEKKETPITPEEVRKLDKYCSERFIELAANQNMLGHMEPWLITEELNDLAECPDGYSLIPGKKVVGTIDPTDSRTMPLLTQMTEDLLPNFSSDIFNVNLDEPFELGKCKNEDLAEEIGVGRIYLNHVLEVKKLADTHQKKMWMWADIVGKHPEIIEDLPKDITLLEWGYEAEHPFINTTTRIKDAGLDFIVCPGTSSWMSLTGRTDNMLGNINNAVTSGVRNGAKGMLLTDWGDLGHWQYLPVSYAGFAYAATMSWNSSVDRQVPLEAYLNAFFFADKAGEMGRVALDIGRYNQFEDVALPNASNAFFTYQLGIMDPVLQDAIPGIMQSALGDIAGPELAEAMKGRFENRRPYALDSMLYFLEGVEQRLDRSEMNFREVNTVKDELRNGMNMVRLGSQMKAFGREKAEMSLEERITELEAMKTAVQAIQLEHERLWLLRNKPGGLERSLKTFRSTEEGLDRQLELARGSGINRQVDRLKEKVIAGGADWYAN